MDLDGARNAKAEIFRNAFRFVEAGSTPLRRTLPHFVADFETLSAAAGAPQFATLLNRDSDPLHAGESRARSADLRLEPIDPLPVAVGIGRSRSPGVGNEVLLLGPRKNLEAHPMVERAVELARGEARYVHAGTNMKFSHWHPARRRPVCPGLSIAHYRVQSGTLGAFVDLGEEGVGILSNNHVLADLNRGQLGDAILQPAKRDGGARPADVIATLHRYVELRAGTPEVNRVDAAIGRLAGDEQPLADLPGDTLPPPRMTGVGDNEPLPDDPVLKFGRTTGATRGLVFAIEVDNYTVNLGSSSRPFLCRFDDQLQAYSPDGYFALPGDSGSVLLGSEASPLGLIFAGSIRGGPSGYGIATINPISVVLEELDTRLLIA